MCLARQVQVQNVKRHGPLQVLMSEDQMAAAAAAASGGKPQRFGQMSWAQQHSGQSLDSQLSKIQLAQAALEKADMFKVRSHSDRIPCSITHHSLCMRAVLTSRSDCMPSHDICALVPYQEADS